MRLLLVEDDAELAGVLTAGLAEHGFDIVHARSFVEGWERATLVSFGVIILDVLIPGGTGLDLCARLRREGILTPILMLTALGSIDDRVTGLESGADDYLTKPFAFGELLARIRALARRQPGLIRDVRRIANVTVDLRGRTVARSDSAIELTNKEWDLLELFVRNEGRVVGRAEISAWVWDENHDPFTNVLEVLVARLRRKIDHEFEPKLIHTLRGAGYRFGP